MEELEGRKRGLYMLELYCMYMLNSPNKNVKTFLPVVIGFISVGRSEWNITAVSIWFRKTIYPVVIGKEMRGGSGGNRGT